MVYPRSEGHFETIYAIAPSRNQLQTVRKKTAIERRMFGAALHEEFHMGGMGNHEPKRSKSQLLVGPGSFHVELRRDSSLPDTFVRGLSQKVSWVIARVGVRLHEVHCPQMCCTTQLLAVRFFPGEDDVKPYEMSASSL